MSLSNIQLRVHFTNNFAYLLYYIYYRNEATATQHTWVILISLISSKNVHFGIFGVINLCWQLTLFKNRYHWNVHGTQQIKEIRNLFLFFSFIHLLYNQNGLQTVLKTENHVNICSIFICVCVGKWMARCMKIFYSLSKLFTLVLTIFVFFFF